uniref:Uncharacterized protein n=1 Tax=Molossus molossus TaxID=27622 RepID=A0A7J8JW11_MOLMO|nr:hypothetical protein HJG59_008075 [Molossus molossus]
MGLSRVKGGALAGKEVKGWIVKHKTNVCSSPGVTGERGSGLLHLPLSGDPWGPREARAALMAGQNHQEGLRGCSMAKRSRRAHRLRGQKGTHPGATASLSLSHSLLWKKKAVVVLEFHTLPSPSRSAEVSSLKS